MNYTKQTCDCLKTDLETLLLKLESKYEGEFSVERVIYGEHVKAVIVLKDLSIVSKKIESFHNGEIIQATIPNRPGKKAQLSAMGREYLDNKFEWINEAPKQGLLPEWFGEEIMIKGNVFTIFRLEYLPYKNLKKPVILKPVKGHKKKRCSAALIIRQLSD